MTNGGRHDYEKRESAASLTTYLSSLSYVCITLFLSKSRVPTRFQRVRVYYSHMMELVNKTFPQRPEDAAYHLILGR